MSVNPLVNQETIKRATDEEIEAIYLMVYSSFDMEMQEVLGESIFDDEY